MAKLLTKKQIIEDVCSSVQSEFNISSVAHLNNLSVSARCGIEYCDPSVTLSDSTMYELILDTMEPKLYHIDFTNIKNFASTNDYNSVVHFYVELSIETPPNGTKPVDDVYIYVRDDHKRPINMMATVGEVNGSPHFSNGIIYYLVDGDVIHLKNDRNGNRNMAIGNIVQHGELRKDLCNMETYNDASLTVCRKVKLKDIKNGENPLYSYYIPASKTERVSCDTSMELVTRDNQNIIFNITGSAQQANINFFIGKVIRETGRLREYDSSIYHYDTSTLNYVTQRQPITVNDKVVHILPEIRKEDVSTTAPTISDYSIIDRVILDSSTTATTTISVEDKLIKK